MTQGVESIFKAAASNNVDLLEEAMKTAGVNDRDHNGMTPLHHAAANLAFDTAQKLRNDPNIDVNIADNFGRLPAFIAEDIFGRQSFTDRMRGIIFPPSPEDTALDDEDRPGFDEPA